MGAGCKSQATLSNVDENELVSAGCNHVHEGTQDVNGAGRRTYFPGEEEAGYATDLVFGFAITLSMWALQVGRAEMAVHEPPTTQVTGNRVSWIDLDPRWRMVTVAVSLGIRQRGVFNGEYTLGPRVPFGLSEDEHFCWAI